MTTQQKGHVAQLKVEQRALEKGFIVSRPTTESRYDLVIDDGKSLARVQVKYASGLSLNSSGAIIVPLRKMHKNRVLVYSEVEIDLVLAYIPVVDKIVRLMPAQFHGKPQFIVRLAPALNGQKMKVNRLEDLIW